MRNRSYTLLLAGFLSVLMLTSCNDNPVSFSESPPALPTARSMEMDFSSFIITSQKSEKPAIKTVDNFSQAIGIAFKLNNIVEDHLVIPHTLFAAAESVEPEFSDEGNWKWSYSQSARGENYSVVLTASRTSKSVFNWNFEVTNSSLGLDQSLLFSGKTNADSTGGTWNYYSLQNQGEQISQLDWQTAEDESIQLRLEITSKLNGYQGDYIEYDVKGMLEKSVYFDDSNSSIVELEINPETKSGYILAPAYNSGEKSCWDADLQDIACTDL